MLSICRLNIPKIKREPLSDWLSDEKINSMVSSKKTMWWRSSWILASPRAYQTEWITRTSERYVQNFVQSCILSFLWHGYLSHFAFLQCVYVKKV